MWKCSQYTCPPTVEVPVIVQSGRLCGISWTKPFPASVSAPTVERGLVVYALCSGLMAGCGFALLLARLVGI